MGPHARSVEHRHEGRWPRPRTLGGSSPLATGVSGGAVDAAVEHVGGARVAQRIGAEVVVGVGVDEAPRSLAGAVEAVGAHEAAS